VPLTVPVAEKDRHEKLLKDIQKDVRTLLEKNFNAGQKYLEAAYRSNSEKHIKIYLHDARKAFVNASVTSAPIYRAKAMRLAALCYDLLDDKVNAEAQYRSACEYAFQQYKGIIDNMEESASRTLIDIALGVSLIGQPLMYARWTARYRKKKN
jgi:hypothetical protein